MNRDVRAFVGKPWRDQLQSVRHQLRLARARLRATHACPVCGRRYRFEAYGDPPRPAAECPGCGALERHRLLWLFLSREILPLRRRGYRILHCAPERGLALRLRALEDVEYVSIDRFSEDGVTARMDLTSLGFRAEMFDLVICSHVLEHIPDDQTAMHEIRRVTKTDGVALLNVPYDSSLEYTYEDWSITTPEGRRKAFGQHDHVRMYSPRDYASRLGRAGWRVTEISYSDQFSQEEVRRFGLPSDDNKTVFRCDRL